MYLIDNSLINFIIVLDELTNNTNHRRKYPARNSCRKHFNGCNICIQHYFGTT